MVAPHSLDAGRVGLPQGPGKKRCIAVVASGCVALGGERRLYGAQGVPGPGRVVASATSLMFTVALWGDAAVSDV